MAEIEWSQLPYCVYGVHYADNGEVFKGCLGIPRNQAFLEMRDALTYYSEAQKRGLFVSCYQFTNSIEEKS